MNNLTVGTIAQGVGVLLMLLMLYSVSQQDVAALSTLTARADAQLQANKALRAELDALLQAHSRTERVAHSANDALTSVHADLASLDGAAINGRRCVLAGDVLTCAFPRPTLARLCVQIDSACWCGAWIS
jgi:hypothetical protein